MWTGAVSHGHDAVHLAVRGGRSTGLPHLGHDFHTLPVQRQQWDLFAADRGRHHQQ